MMVLEDNYFNINAISNSSLGWLKQSPILFKNSTTFGYEKKDNLSLERGSLLHLFILEPQKFIVADIKPITGMLGTFIKEMSKSDDLEQAYKKSGFTLSLEKVKENFMKEESQSYYKFLKQSDGKLAIPSRTKYLLDKAKDNLIANKKSNDLLFNDFIHSKNNIEIYIEYVIEFLYEGVNCKAKIDKFFIDHKNKKIILVDLKTTGKPMYKFKESFLFYEYNRQLAFYKKAIQLKFGLDYDFEIFIVAVALDTAHDEAAVFKISNELIKSGEDSYNNLINLYKEHLKYGFDFPMEYYLSKDGSIKLEYE